MSMNKGKPLITMSIGGWKTDRVQTAEQHARDQDEPVCWCLTNLHVHDLAHLRRSHWRLQTAFEQCSHALTLLKRKTA